nr:hypothetical protein [Escherichia coli]
MLLVWCAERRFVVVSSPPAWKAKKRET